MKKKTFYTELAYLLGICLISLGAACMVAADFGVSMVVAPAYLVYLKLSTTALPFFTFGMAEYTLQALLLILMCLILRRFRVYYLFSFLTAVFYGLLLDANTALVGLLPANLMSVRVLLYLGGLVFCAVGVAMVFHTYIPPEVYELFVKELAPICHMPDHRLKTIYDLTSCVLSVLISFAFFGLGRFEGVKWGTVICAVVDGWMIGVCSRWMEKHFAFRDRLKLRPFFESRQDA